MSNYIKYLKSQWFHILLFFCIIFLAIIYHYQFEDAGFDSDTCYKLNTGWSYENDNKRTIPIELPTIIHKKHNSVSIHYTLPSGLQPNKSICIRTSQQSIEAYLENKKIYSYGMKKIVPFGTTSGSCWNIIKIPENSDNKTLTVFITNNYPAKSNSIVIHEVYYGTKAALLYQIAKNYAINFFIAVIIFFIGMALIILYLIFRKNLADYNMTWNLGLFAVLIAIWMLGESKTNQFFIGNQFFVLMMVFLSQMLCAIPLLLYIKKMEKYRFQKGINLFILLFAINFILCFLLQIFHILDLYLTIKSTHILILITIVYLVITLFIEMFYYRNTEIGWFTISAIILFVFSVIEIVNYYFGTNMNTGIYVRSGMLIFICVLSVNSVRKVVNTLELMKSACYYEKLAKTDLMTNCKNRTAYIKDLEAISKNETNLNNIAVFIMDINNLKEINDNYGHQIGDFAIIKCSEYIEKTLGNIGQCYRIGGDEFTCIIHKCKTKDLQVYEKQFLSWCKLENKICNYGFEVAIGYAIFDSNLDKRIEDVVNRADKNMYEMKKAMKLNKVQEE